MEGQGRSRKIKEGQGRSRMVFSHGWSFPITGLTFKVKKVIGGGWGGSQLDSSVSPSQSQSQSLFSVLGTREIGLGFRT